MLRAVLICGAIAVVVNRVAVMSVELYWRAVMTQGHAYPCRHRRNALNRHDERHHERDKQTEDRFTHRL